MTTQPTEPKKRPPVLRTALWSLVALVIAVLVGVWAIGLDRTGEFVANATEPYGTPFALVDQNDQPFTQNDLRGAASAVFFGFTHCPDICPTTLYELAGHKKALQEEGRDFQIVFVTVDPARDTPEILQQYVSSLGTDVTALSGPQAAVESMLEGWGIHHQRVGDGDNYTMDHIASVLLLGSAGQFIGTLAYGENPDTVREKLERLVTL